MLENLAVVIPAAGESKRLGGVKQLLKWKDTTLIGHCIRKAQQLKPKYCIVIIGSNRELIKKEVDNYGAISIHAEKWKEGMGASIAQGVTELLHTSPELEQILIMLPDQPLVTEEHLQKLLNKANDHSLVASHYGNNKAGVPAVISKEFFSELTGLSGDIGARSIFASHPDKLTVLEPDFVLKDIDTMEDYMSLIEKIE